MEEELMLVRYYGHVGMPTGYGDAANEMCMAIVDAGLDLEISTDGRQLHRRYLPLSGRFKSQDTLQAPDVVIIHTLPLDCPVLLQLEGIRERYPKALCVAYTTWECASEMPVAMWDALESSFDKVWVPSHATRDAIAIGGWTHDTHGYLQVVPHPFDEVRLGERNTPRIPREDERYRFYYVGAWNTRKNVDGLIRAYYRAFESRDAVELILHTDVSGSACELAMMSTGVDPDLAPLVRLSNQRIPDEDVRGLHMQCDCFVTASRGEAWCLPAFDALLAGNHVIATQCLGSDDYLMDTTAELTHSRLAPAYGDIRMMGVEGAPPGYAKAQCVHAQGVSVSSDWRDPDIADLALRMRRAYAARTTTSQVSYNLNERYGRKAVGARIRELLENGVPK